MGWNPNRREVLLLGPVLLTRMGHVIRERVDAIELNHKYEARWSDDPEPEVTVIKNFVQMIFLDYSAWDGMYHVTTYRTLKKEGPPHPRFDRSRKEWVVQWYDHQTNTLKVRRLLREVRAVGFVETHTFHDPELEDREFVKVADRRGLRYEHIVRQL